MKNSNLIIKLKSLNNVQPDEKFLKENRELLLAQISNSGQEKLAAWEKILITSENLVRLFSRPAFALGAFVLVLLGANFVSTNILEKSKPNDSLYVARVISERLKVNTTINSESREKLAMTYALRHAEDIATILSDAKYYDEENSDQLAKLSNDFISEVNKVETSISRLSSSGKIATEKVEVNNTEVVGEMIIADNSKDESGLEIFIPEDENEVIENTASSSEEIKEEVVVSSPTSKTTKAKELAENKEFGAAVNELNEVVELIK